MVGKPIKVNNRTKVGNPMEEPISSSDGNQKLDDISIALAPTLSVSLMIASGLFWIPWWLMIGIELWRQSRGTVDKGI